MPWKASTLCPRRASLWRTMLDDYHQHARLHIRWWMQSLCIEISGLLIHPGSWDRAVVRPDSYEGIAAQIEAGLRATRQCVASRSRIDALAARSLAVLDLADRSARCATTSRSGFVQNTPLGLVTLSLLRRPYSCSPATGRLGSIGVVVIACRTQRPARSGRRARDADPFGRQQGLTADPYERFRRGAR